MAIFRCKMCGGDLVIDENSTVCECEYCGSKQTVPTVQDDALQGLFNRANVLRMKSEFDKAAEIYEKILQRSETEAEAYWGLILCKYGIEYVEDPQTFRRVPTCHRASYDAVTADEDYRRAVQYADPGQKALYEQQAAEIDAIQKGIIALAQKEDPYDVFICYKETGEDGKRTQDSVIANDIYHQLTLEGFKVFYAPITLENKLGSEYEPYIFSALNTAKVMLALGTKPEYFNAVWVRNEWSRFLKIMKKDRTKLLIPCFRDMDPYELPEEFAHLQAQDMSKIGFISDLVRGIKKVIAKDEPQPQTKETVVVQQSGSGTTSNAQVKRGNMALEDGEWDKADGFFEEALNLDPECAEAYLGKLLAREKRANFEAWVTAQRLKYASQTTERLEACPADSAHIAKKAAECALPGYLDEQTIRKLYDYDRGYDSALSCRKAQKTKQLRELDSERLLTRAKQYADGAVKKQIEDAAAAITAVLDQRIAQAQNEDTASIARVKSAYAAHIAEADRKAEALNADAQKQREAKYQAAAASVKSAADIPGYKKAIEALNAMNGYKDSRDLIAQCNKEIEQLEEEARQEKDRQAAIARNKAEQAKHKAKIIAAITIPSGAVVIAFLVVLFTVIIPSSKYNAAVELMESGEYDEAIAAFEVLEGYKDSDDQVAACETVLKDIDYDAAVELMELGEYDEAIAAFEALEGYKDSDDQVAACETALKDIDYDAAVELMESGEYDEAIAAFEALEGYKDSDDQVAVCETALKDIDYDAAVELMDSGEYHKAIAAFIALDGYKDSAYLISEMKSEIQHTPEMWSGLEAGDHVYFGSYNGEEIEWRVLDQTDDAILLISEYGLDEQPYNTEYESVTWETCTLRSWLNDDFFNVAFNSEEQSMIQTTSVVNDDNSEYDTDGGNDTQDKVFLLSLDEAVEYFADDEDRMCVPTAYAVAQGAFTIDSYTVGGAATCWWWLRSPGSYSDLAADVNYDGSLLSGGDCVDCDYGCVRPAFWLNLDS